MLRVAGLALSFLVAIAPPAEANDIEGATKVGPVAAREGASTAAMRAVTRERAAAVPLGRAPMVQPLLPGGFLAGLRHEVVDETAGPVALRPQRRQRRNALVSWLSDGRSGMAVPLTERFLVELGYRHVQGEDLWRQSAGTGLVDYDSHHVLVRAHWRF